MLQCLLGCLKYMTPRVKILDTLDLEFRIISSRLRLLGELVPEVPPPQAPHTAYLMQVPPAGPLQQAPVKKEVTPAERWYM